MAKTQRQRLELRSELRSEQLPALAVLAEGKSDAEAAEAAGVPLATIIAWRQYDPAFQAALNRRRLQIWEASLDRLRALLPRALEAL